MIHEKTAIDRFFIYKIRNIVRMESVLREHPSDTDILREAKKMGFSDREAGRLWSMTEKEIAEFRMKAGMAPVYKMIDTCASEFESYVPYFYSNLHTTNSIEN